MHRDDNDGQASDRAFERLLLQSARNDDPSERDARRVWSNFSASMTHAALPPASDAGTALLGRLGRLGAAKFLAGAVIGSALTALWLHARPPVAPLLPIIATAVPSQVVSAASQSHPLPTPPASVSEPTPPRKLERARRTAAKNAETAAATGSTLAAEIEALDAARTMFAAGRYEQVSQLSKDYRRRFPGGQLAREAEALAIEALALQGDHAAAALRAQIFLAHYPNDTHAGRLAALAKRDATP